MPTNTVLAFIEIPQGSRNKYEYDEERGTFKLDRVLYSSVQYPTDYGVILDTLAEGSDHLDILGLVQEPTFKILAVQIGGPRYAHVETLADVGGHWLREIEIFSATYKLLEPKQTEVVGWHNAAEA